MHGLRDTLAGKSRALPGEPCGKVHLSGLNVGKVGGMRFGLRSGGRVGERPCRLSRRQKGSERAEHCCGNQQAIGRANARNGEFEGLARWSLRQKQKQTFPFRIIGAISQMG